ncbi:MAG: septation protein spoVG [Euryarchaeota archaeon]|nr:septation protein spoVG [Euryarchaeota archaeon]
MADITEVRIFTGAAQGNLRAYATVTLDDSYVVHGLKVMEGENGLWVSMPAQRTRKGEFKDVFHPVTKEARAALVDAVLSKYEEVSQGQGDSVEPAQDVQEERVE